MYIESVTGETVLLKQHMFTVKSQNPLVATVPLMTSQVMLLVDLPWGTTVCFQFPTKISCCMVVIVMIVTMMKRVL